MSRKALHLKIAVVVILGCLSASAALRADVTLHAIFRDDMVLQREMSVPVWGTADAGEVVTVKLQGQRVAAAASAKGEWRVKLAPMKAGGPHELTVTGKNTIKIVNVLVGDVWVCGGQSNMAMSVRASMNSKEEVAAADYPEIRLFRVVNTKADEPQKDLRGRWLVCGPRTVSGFTAVGYFFGRKLHKDLGVPIGLIHSNWGGTPAEAWTGIKALESDPAFTPLLERWQKIIENYPAAKAKYDNMLAEWRKAAETARAEGRRPPRRPRRPRGPDSPSRPAALYNAMIHPLIPFAIKGAIWYQGEANAGRAEEYRKLLPAMIGNWRTAWGQGDFPFLIVQLANFMTVSSQPTDTGWARLREAQCLTARALPNCGLAAIIDTGEARDIHPKNKQDVGKRLALVALAKVYGKRIVYSGPEYESMRVEGARVRLKFKHTGSGLAVRTSEMPNYPNMIKQGYRFTLGDAPVKGFAIAGDDRKFVWAQAKIDGETVLVWSDKVAKPVAVRYAWANNPVCNLYNREGLPAAPFRTDDW